MKNLNRMQINKWIVRGAYLYIFLPILLFMIGWCRYAISIPVSVLILVGLFNLCRDGIIQEELQWDKKAVKKELLVILIIAAWVFLSGIGGYVWQTGDHSARNGIFQVLVEEPWPVIKSIDGTERGLIYYIGFWMLPSLVGKAFGLAAGYFAQYIWAVVGLLFFYYFVCLLQKKIVIWPLLIFIFFSGWDVVGRLLVGGWEGFLHQEWWGKYYQYSSFTTQLFWVFNQAIPAWLITIILYLQKKNRYMIFLLSTALLYCTLPFVGMLPFVAYFMLRRHYSKSGGRFVAGLSSFLKDTFSLENVLCGGCIGILSFLYLSGNVAAQHFNVTAYAEMNPFPRPMVVQAAEMGDGDIIIETAKSFSEEESGYDNTQIIDTSNRMVMYMFFIALEVLIYAIPLYMFGRKDKLLLLILGWLLICPLVHVGFANDFCMRASVPALLFLYLFVIQRMDMALKNHNRTVLDLFVAVLLIGSLTVMAEFKSIIVNTNKEFRESGITVVSEEEILTGNNFSGELEGNVFYQNIAK